MEDKKDNKDHKKEDGKEDHKGDDKKIPELKEEELVI